MLGDVLMKRKLWIFGLKKGRREAEALHFFSRNLGMLPRLKTSQCVIHERPTIYSTITYNCFAILSGKLSLIQLFCVDCFTRKEIVEERNYERCASNLMTRLGNLCLETFLLRSQIDAIWSACRGFSGSTGSTGVINGINFLELLRA